MFFSPLRWKDSRATSLLNLFLANVPILNPLKTPENTSVFGGIKWENWPEMG